MNAKTIFSALPTCVLIAAFLLLGGCSKPEAADEPSVATAPPVAPTPEAAPAATASGPTVDIQAGISYAQAREQLIAAGWVAPALPTNGFAESDAKVKAECNGSVALCTSMPEIDACSGSDEGACVMNWSSANGKRLRVSTTGGLAQAKVQSFELLAATGAPEMVCPSPVFNDFLKAFRDDVNVQRAFTADPLDMTYLDTTSADASPRTQHKSLDWAAINKPVMVSSDSLGNEGLVQTIEGSDQRYQVVETQPGTGTKKTYDFSQVDGCWRLTAINDQSI
jgi:hypothetical protein